MASPSPVDLQSIIDMLISNMNGKGGTSAANLNLLGNDIFGAVTGTSNDKAPLTDDEAIAQYQPTLAQVLSTGDVNSPEYILADMMGRGVPVVTIKREILKSITESSIPPEEEDTLMSFVDTLDKEQRSYQEYKRKPVEDSNTKMGLPAKTDRFNPVDIAPEVFQSMLSKMDTAQKGVNARVSQIDANSPKEISYKSGTPEFEKLLQKEILNQWSKSNKPWQEQDNSGSLPAYNLGDILQNAKISWTDPLAINSLFKGARQVGGGILKDIFNPDSPKEDKQNMSKAAQKEAAIRAKNNPNATLTDKKQNAINKAEANYLKELAGAAAPAMKDSSATDGMVWDAKLKKFRMPTGKEFGTTVQRTQAVNLRDPVAAQQRVMELTAKKIASGLEKMNYTPGNIAMIQKLIAARGMQNG